MIKISLLFDGDLFAHLKNNKPITGNEIYQAIKLKNNIVLKDPYDKDLRMFLNFGHTFGHQIELKNNINHGKAISHGILIALEIGINLNKTKKAIYDTVKEVLTTYKLVNNLEIKKDAYLDIIWHDKKHLQDGLKFIIIKDIEKPEIITLNKGDIF
jgi:3-dehydroquinate synthase